MYLCVQEALEFYLGQAMPSGEKGTPLLGPELDQVGLTHPRKGAFPILSYATLKARLQQQPRRTCVHALSAASGLACI